MKWINACVAILLLSCAATTTAKASIQVFEYSGTINRVDSTIQGIVPFTIGTPFTGRFSWDSTNPGVQSGATFASYSFGSTAFEYSLEWTIAGITFRETSGEPFVISVDDKTVNDDVFDISTYNAALPAGWSVSGGQTHLQLNLRDGTATALDGTVLPEELDPQDFGNVTQIALWFPHASVDSSVSLTTPLGSHTQVVGTPSMFFTGNIESIQRVNAEVPEPASLIVWSLLGLAGIGIAWRRSLAA